MKWQILFQTGLLCETERGRIEVLINVPWPLNQADGMKAKKNNSHFSLLK